MNAALASILERIEDPQHLLVGAAFREGIARMQFAVEHHLGLAALVGDAGTGKTTLLRCFRRELASTAACVLQLRLKGLSSVELQTTFAEQLGVRTPYTWLRIVERLTELGYDQTPLIVLVDDANHASPESLDFLNRVWDADPTGQLRITMILATDELSMAGWPESWLQRIDLRVELERWSLDDVHQFLGSIIGSEQQSYGAKHNFEPAAIEQLHRLSAGLPRPLRRYAHLALLATAEQGRTVVDEATVTGASHELCRAGMPHHHTGPAIEFVDDLIVD